MMKPVKNRNVVLVGFMGSGKSLAAQMLHQRLQWPCFSTDYLIEQKEKKSISVIFKNSGEAHFRELEQGVVKDLAARQGIIIDCGGGVVLNPENIRLLKKNGTVFYLKASAEVIYERIKNEKHRPLLDTDNPLQKIKTLLNQRQVLYEQADFVVDANDKSVLLPVEEILNKMKENL